MLSILMKKDRAQKQARNSVMVIAPSTEAVNSQVVTV